MIEVLTFEERTLLKEEAFGRVTGQLIERLAVCERALGRVAAAETLEKAKLIAKSTQAQEFGKSQLKRIKIPKNYTHQSPPVQKIEFIEYVVPSFTKKD